MVRLTSCLTSLTTISCTDDRSRWVTTTATWRTRCLSAYWSMWPSTWQVRKRSPWKPKEELRWRDPKRSRSSIRSQLGLPGDLTARLFRCDSPQHYQGVRHKVQVQAHLRQLFLHPEAIYDLQCQGKNPCITWPLRMALHTWRSTCLFVLLQLKITEYDGEPLTQEDRREMVYLSVTQKKSWKWEVKSEAEPRTSATPHSSNTTDWQSEENMPEEMKLPISPEGEVHLSIPISERTRSLTVDVRCCPAVVLVQ